ncbi:hypothetical protein HED63_25795 [Ochrobactrum cytisi]|nr:hypothetical protein [Brucella cytisi]
MTVFGFNSLEIIVAVQIVEVGVSDDGYGRHFCKGHEREIPIPVGKGY